MVNGLVRPLGLSLCVGLLEGRPLLNLEVVRFADALGSLRAGDEVATGACVLLVGCVPTQELLHRTWVTVGANWAAVLHMFPAL